MRIDSSGVTKFIPTKAYGDTSSSVKIGGTFTGTNYSDGSHFNLVFGDDDATNSYMGSITVEQLNASASTASEMRFYTNAGGGNGGINPNMVITSSGNVGIGTTSPDFKTHLYDSGNTVLGITAGVANYAALQFGSTSDTTRGAIEYYTGDDSLRLKTGNNTEAMRIDSNGRVLIDSTTAYPNSVATGAYLVAINDGVYWAAHFAANSTVSRDVVAFSNPNGKIGAINTNGTTTSYETSSDYRLKENVVEMTGALDRVDALKPSRFNFIADADKTVDGFLAHEVADVVPEAISGEKDAVDEEGNAIYQGIDQSKLVPLLVGAIQELRAEIETLKSQIQ